MKKIKILFFFSFLPLILAAAPQKPHPIRKVNQWYKAEKERSGKGFHKFATLATVSQDNHPMTRMVELVGFSQGKGALFFTHRNTTKVEHLTSNPHAALNIWLPKTLRQVSMTGTVVEIPRQDAEKSWKRMPRFMKLTFMASEHKGEIDSPDVLQKRKAKLEELYKNDIPMPDAFVGYRFQPDTITFYEIKPRNFPHKEIAHLDHDKWVVSLMEP